MSEDIALISSGREMKQALELIISSLAMTSIHYPDVEGFSRHRPEKMPFLILVDLDSVELGHSDLKCLNRMVGQSKVIGVSVSSYNPHLKQSVQNGIFTALIKQPIEEELIYWINSLLGMDNPERASKRVLDGQSR